MDTEFCSEFVFKMASVTLFASINLPKAVCGSREGQFMYLMWCPDIGFVVTTMHAETGLVTRIHIYKSGCQRIICDKSAGRLVWCEVDFFQLVEVMKGNKIAKNKASSSSSGPRTTLSVGDKGLSIEFNVDTRLPTQFTIPLDPETQIGNESSLPDILRGFLRDNFHTDATKRLLSGHQIVCRMACSEFRKHIVEQAVFGDTTQWRANIDTKTLEYHSWIPFRSSIEGTFTGMDIVSCGNGETRQSQATIDTCTVFQLRNTAACAEHLDMYFLSGSSSLLCRFGDSTRRWTLDLVVPPTQL